MAEVLVELKEYWGRGNTKDMLYCIGKFPLIHKII
jgi:hypothetical protein